MENRAGNVINPQQVRGRPQGRSGNGARLVFSSQLNREDLRVGAGPQRDDYVWERVVSDMDFAAETGALIIADHVKHPLPKLDEVMDTKFDSSTPPVAPSDETKSKFEIQFVDEVGEGLEGLELVFVHRGKEEKQKTDSSGVAKFTGEGSFGSVRLASIDSLRKLIEPRWLKARLPKPYQAKSIQQATLGSKFESIGLEAEQRHVVQLMPELGRIYLELYDKSGRIKQANKPYRITGPTAFAGETDADARLLHDDVVAGQYKLTLTLDKTDYTTPVEVLSAGNSTPQVRKLGVVPRSLMASVRGFVFEKNKAFVMPAAIESLQEVRELFFSTAPSDVLIVGHADTTAEPKINDPLSLDRADCTQAMLLGDVDSWLDMYGTAMPEKQRWGGHEDGLMIAAMTDYGMRPASENAVRWYQRTRNLTVDGNCGTKTRTKLIEEYMGLVGEPLAKDADFNSKLTTHGCGENFPLDESGENLDPNPADPKDDAIDRRVEFFYFDTEYGIQPPVKGKNSAKGSTEYPKWREGVNLKCVFAVPEAPLEEALVSDCALTYFAQLAKKMSQKEFVVWCANLFGYDIPKEASISLQNDLTTGKFRNPPIKLHAGLINGHEGAYGQKDHTIKISRSVVASAETNDDDAWKTLAILLEEFGHHVDNRLRFQYSTVGGDAPLDEGARFAYNLIYWEVPKKTSLDFAVYHRKSEAKTLTVDYKGFAEAVDKWLNEHEQDRDDRDIDNEYFGAGMGSGSCSSYAHEKIEKVLEDELRFSRDQRRQVYFGNWMRDYSQIVDPFVLKKKFSLFNTEFTFTRKTLTKVVDYLGRQHFGQDRANGKRTFLVDESRLGVYRPEEHIDNPCGIDPEGPKFGEFRPGCPAGSPELQIDPNSWFKKYIAESGAWAPTSIEYVNSKLDQAFAEGMTPEGFRHLGAALHVLEDFYAHSNFVEIALQRNFPSVITWTRKMSNGHYPIVTGVFGSLDTIATLSAEIAKLLMEGGECVPGKRAKGAELALILMEDIDKKWRDNADAALKTIETLEEEHPKVATFWCRTGGQIFRLIDFALGVILRAVADTIDDFQTKFGGFSATPENATHSQLSKDHDNHPLHVPAALCAVEIARGVGGAMKDAWEGRRSIAEVKGLARSYFVHPELMDTTRRDNRHAQILKIIADWSASHPSEIATASSETWMQDQCRRHKKYLQQAKQISKDVTGDDSTITKFMDLLIELGK